MPHLGGGLHSNRKTGLSVDFTTLCRRMRSGHPCVYCYVQRGRATKIRGKRIIDEAHYDGFVRRMESSKIEEMNAVGGIRLFAYADYLPRFDTDFEAFFADAEEAGLKVKAITKEVEFVQKYHDYPALSCIHVSVDNLGGPPEGRSPISHSQAVSMLAAFRKVLVRAAVLDWEDLEFFEDQDWVSILTLNHAVWPKRGKKTFHLFSRKEKQQIASQHPGRICASGPSGHCADCPVKCGVFTHLREKEEPVCV